MQANRNEQGGVNMGEKRINPNCRSKIDQMKSNIRCSNGKMLMGDGYIFATAIRELRKSGMNILYHRSTGDYQVVVEKEGKHERS